MYRSQSRVVKRLFRAILPAVIGVVALSFVSWRGELSLQALAVPLDTSHVTLLFVVAGIAFVATRRGFVVEAVSLLAGSAAAWALLEARLLGLCNSDLLYRSCTATEIGSMAFPVFFLVGSAALILTFRFRGPVRPR